MPNHKTSPTHTGLLTKATQSYPDKWALSAGKFEISHSCLEELDAVLRSAGVSPGDDVVLPFPNSIKLVIMLQADSNGYPLVQAAASRLGITQVTVSLPVPTGPVHISVPTLNDDSTYGLVHDSSNDPSDGALLFHNSGTTSQPKVIALTQHNLVALVQSIPTVSRMTNSDSTVVVLPLFYVHGLLAGLLSLLSAGGSVTLASLGQFSDNPEANEAAFLFRWFHTGHLESEDDYLHLVGRVKELINNGGSFQVERITVDVGVPINVELEVPEVDLEDGLGNQTSLPANGEQNTFHIEGIAGPDPLSVPNGSNGIWHLRYITACNFVSNATVGVLYLGEKLQGCNDIYQRAELIASVGAPIAVAAGTFVASILFASNPEKWSYWISGMSMINAGMTIGGPLSFNWVRT